MGGLLSGRCVWGGEWCYVDGKRGDENNGEERNLEVTSGGKESLTVALYATVTEGFLAFPHVGTPSQIQGLSIPVSDK